MNNDLDEDAASVRRAQGKKVRMDGQDWHIYEREATATQAASLVFESKLVVRRVKSYPANWRVLDEAALFALSWGR